jgi:hypothetical protein
MAVLEEQAPGGLEHRPAVLDGLRRRPLAS